MPVQLDQCYTWHLKPVWATAVELEQMVGYYPNVTVFWLFFSVSVLERAQVIVQTSVRTRYAVMQKNALHTRSAFNSCTCVLQTQIGLWQPWYYSFVNDFCFNQCHFLNNCYHVLTNFLQNCQNTAHIWPHAVPPEWKAYKKPTDFGSIADVLMHCNIFFIRQFGFVELFECITKC